jgi:hypothetical protein
LAILSGTLNSDSESYFGYKSLQNRAVLGGSKRFFTKRFHMKGNSRAHVGERILIAIPSAKNCPASDPEEIGDIPIRMLLHDQLHAMAYQRYSPNSIHYANRLRSMASPIPIGLHAQREEKMQKKLKPSVIHPK